MRQAIAVAPSPALTPADRADDESVTSREPGFRELIRDAYLTVDRRTLGLTRILLGVFLVLDLFRRTHDWLDMFSDQGILPSQLILQHPQADNFSLFHAFSTAGELWVLWGLGLIAYSMLLVGYKTKLAQIASLVFVTSMNGRVLLIENGGYVIQNLLLLWTCFMPMGDRFSVDALVASMGRRREHDVAALGDREALADPRTQGPAVTLAMLAVLLQLSALYFFNVVHKTGPAWKNGTAVHFVLYNDRMATPFVGYVRDYLPLPLILFLTKTTLVFEAALPICLLTPIGRTWARRAVVFMMCTLHIAFGTTFTLGPFAWSCCLFATLMFSEQDWSLAARTMRREHRARTVVLREGSATALWVGRLLARLDAFELLRFRSEPSPEALVVVIARGERLTGAFALADIVAAFPLGPIIAWIPRLPGLRSAVSAVMRMGASWLEPNMRSGGASLPMGSPFSRFVARTRVGVREALAAVMLLAAINQAGVELWSMRRFHFSQREPMLSLAHKLRFLQGWFMFSPNPVMDDGIVVCDAETADGRHLDPFTGKAPSYVLDASVQFNQIWQDYMNRIQLPGNTVYRDALKSWILRYHERVGRPEDRIVMAKVYWIHDINPQLGKTASTDFDKRELLSFDTRKP